MKAAVREPDGAVLACGTGFRQADVSRRRGADTHIGAAERKALA